VPEFVSKRGIEARMPEPVATASPLMVDNAFQVDAHY
jgi:hypothetical protein